MKPLMTIAALLLLAAGAGAQGPGGRPPGGMQPPSQMRAKFQAWEKWRATHQNIGALQQTIRGLDGLERDPNGRLNKKQANAILAVINKWRARPTLTDVQAQQVVHQIKGNLAAAQLKKIAAGRPGGFGGSPPPGGFRGRGGRGFGGPPPGGANRPPPPGGRGFGGRPPGGFNPAAFPSPKDYNPLNPKTSPFQRDAARSQQRFAALLATLAHTK